MPKLYNSSTPERLKPTGPRPETIKSILNYSKALSVMRYKNMIFETLNN